MKKTNLIVVGVMACFAFIAVGFTPGSAGPQQNKNKPVQTIDLPQTGQTSYTDTAGINDDGALQMGVEWPAPRFIDNKNGTVTDRLTSLVWLKNADCFGISYWYGALGKAYYLKSGDCGLSDNSLQGDWRLPNRNELLSLVDVSKGLPCLPDGHPFINVQECYYWSSSTAIYNSPAGAWVLNTYDGSVFYSPKSENNCFWPVRSEKDDHAKNGPK